MSPQTLEDGMHVEGENLAPFGQILGDSPELRVMQELVSAPDFEYTKLQLANGAKVSRTTLDRVLEKFTLWGVVVQTRKIGHITLYQLNGANPISQAFERFTREMSIVIARQLAETEGAPDN